MPDLNAPGTSIGFLCAFGGVVLALGTLYSFVKARRDIKDFQGAIFRARRGRVEDTRDGEVVALHGRVRASAEGTLTAPFSGREVVYAKATAVAQTRGATDFYDRSASRAFLLDDGSGLAHVDTAKAKVIATATIVDQKGIGAYPPRAAEALRQAGVTVEGLRAKLKAVNFCEEAIAPGDEVWVVGVARRAPGERAASPQPLHMLSGATALVVTTLPPDAFATSVRVGWVALSVYAVLAVGLLVAAALLFTGVFRIAN